MEQGGLIWACFADLLASATHCCGASMALFPIFLSGNSGGLATFGASNSCKSHDGAAQHEKACKNRTSRRCRRSADFKLNRIVSTDGIPRPVTAPLTPFYSIPSPIHFYTPLPYIPSISLSPLSFDSIQAEFAEYGKRTHSRFPKNRTRQKTKLRHIFGLSADC